ncbi:helix-turn-helix domain-containing protein [Enterococcus sp. AZ196]|uniref:helix-turn-helix domain-containing protein n=1 Tax=Enterococcus sp. AZ196 TaxID=2774659 RepID=UPI003D2AEEAF
MDFRGVLGTTNKRRLLLLEHLYYHRDGLSSDQLLDELDCSLPILLNDIELINSDRPNFQIIKIKGLYRIVIDKSMSLGNLYANFLNMCPEFQIIEELLYEECENINELSKKLYLSSSNTQRYLKKIKQTLTEAGMKFCYRPLRIEGDEGEIRNFYYRFYSERQSAFESTLPKLPSAHYHIIERYVQDFVDMNGIHQKYIFQKRLIYSMYISFWRIKSGHTFPKEQLRTEKILLPMALSYKMLQQAVKDGVDLELTPEMLRDALWLTFSDSIVFSLLHREVALAENPKYRRLFMQHYSLAEEFNQLLGNRLTKLNRLDLATVLNNDFYLCEPNGKYIGVLWRNRSVFLQEVSSVYRRGVQKVRDLVERFVTKYHMYQEEDFIQNYVYLLVTTEVNSLEWLAEQDPLLKVLLLSDLTPTEESFLAKQISDTIYGNFEIVLFEQLSGGTPNLWKELDNYDCLITTGASKGLPDDYPVVVIDPFLTTQSVQWIQEMISNLSKQREQITAE